LRDILKGLVRYPPGLLPQIASKGVTNVSYPKGVMKGQTIGGLPILIGMTIIYAQNIHSNNLHIIPFYMKQHFLKRKYTI
jgi:hypothetical protein